MKTFKIDTTYWLRGDNQDSRLLHPDRKFANMCCLGHICEQAGIPKKLLFEMPSPASLTELDVEEYSKISFLLNKHKDNNNKLSKKAMKINDDINITDEVRIEKLKALFLEHKIKLVFK